jgi:hypothetical protein
MRYMFLIYSREHPSDRSEEELERLRAAHYAVMDEAKSNGVFQSAEPLQATITATTVRMERGKPLILDGPFAETKEQLAGYYILDCDNLDEAISWATKIPTSCKGGEGCIEIRPIADLPYLRAMARANS